MKQDEQKTIKIVATIGAVLLLGYFIRRRPDSGSGYGDDPTENNSQNGNGVVFNPKIAAEKLYDAMKEMGTDENAIMQVFQTVSVGNFVKVFNAFKLRSYNDQLGNQYNFNPFISLPTRSLSYWLKKELSSSSFETLRIKYQSTNLI